MTIFFPREHGEKRAALTPENAAKIRKPGLDVFIKAGLKSA